MKIAIVKLSALGDIIHAMVVLQFIKKFDSEILIDWVVEEEYKDLLGPHPDINQVHTINLRRAKKNKSLFMFLNELSRVRKFGPYDMVIDMQGLIKSALVSKLILAKKTIGFDKESLREGLASLFYSDKFNFDYSSNVIERNIALIGFAIGMNISKKQILHKNPFLFQSENQLEIKLSAFKKNILLIPGASHLSKCYHPAKLAELTTLIDANFLVIWGNKKERILANEIKKISDKVIICNQLPLDDLMLLISKIDLVIGPDTGPTHMAWAMNIPSITLFGPTPGYRNTYQTMKNRVIESDSKVNPKKIDKNDTSINNIKVKEILNISKDLI